MTTTTIHKISAMPSATHVSRGSIHVVKNHGQEMDEAGRGTVTAIQGDAHFHETVAAAPLNPRSRTSFRLYAILLVAALNATASGFDGVRDPR